MVLEDGDPIAKSCHGRVIKEEVIDAEISAVGATQKMLVEMDENSLLWATQKTLVEMDEKSPFFEDNPGRELPVFRTKGKICSGG
jgi:hypothetical protein